METRYYIHKDAVVKPGRAVIVSERDLNGKLVGSYNGYYNPRRGVYTLYPRYSSLVWNVKKNYKHEVSDRLVLRDA